MSDLKRDCKSLMVGRKTTIKLSRCAFFDEKCIPFTSKNVSNSYLIGGQYNTKKPKNAVYLEFSVFQGHPMGSLGFPKVRGIKSKKFIKHTLPEI